MSAVVPLSRSEPRPRPATRIEQRLQRERHDPEYGILVAIVALTAIGILMIYSSSSIRAYLATDDTMKVVGPQILWAALGIVAMVVMSRVDYRLLRLASLPLYLVAVAALLLVFVPALNRVIGGSARWLQIGPLPAVHPAEFMKFALVVYLAHWFERKGTGVRKFWTGTVPFLLLTAPVVALVLLEPDLGTASVLAFTGLLLFYLAGANLLHLVLMVAAAVPVVFYKFMHGYQLDRINAWLDPFSVRAGDGYHSVQGYLALALGGIFGAGLGESRLAGGLFVPNASNDFIFAIIGEEFGLIGAGLVILLFVSFAFLGMRTSLGAPDTFGALLAAGITGWICIQAFINIGVVVGVVPVTGIPLPFVSYGGSSLVVSFAAVGVLLAISRETVEKGTWNDAPADRGRRNGRAHLPRAGRRPVAPRSPRRG